MSPALAITTALEYVAAARLAVDSRDRNALLSLAERELRDASEPHPAVMKAAEYVLGAARTASGPVLRGGLLDVAERALRDAAEEFTPVQPIVQREALRKSSQNFKAVSEALEQGRADVAAVKGPIK